MNLLEKLEAYFNVTSNEKVLEDWGKSSKFDQIGLNVYEYFKLDEDINSKCLFYQKSQSLFEEKIKSEVSFGFFY